MIMHHNQLRSAASNMWGLLLIVSCVFSLSSGYNSESIRCLRPNEEAVCVKPCPPERTCHNKGIKFSCLTDNNACTEKCVCKTGYSRNFLGDCISDQNCDRCPGNREYFSCGSACDNECANLHTQNRTNCPIVNIICNEKCYCEDGYARDSNKECVPVEKCQSTPPPTRFPRNAAKQSCGSNEEFTACKKTCPPETCFSIIARFKCDANEPCKPRCSCKHGFLRLKEGTSCVPELECPELKNIRKDKK